MDRKLVTLEHNEKEKKIRIAFVTYVDSKPKYYEEVVLETYEFYELVKDILDEWEMEEIKR